MEQPSKDSRQRKTYTVRDIFILHPCAKTVYHEIFKATVLEGRRCTQISLSDIANLTGIPKSDVDYHLKTLEQKRMIDRDTTKRPQEICINVVYEETIPDRPRNRRTRK
ncbi:MAG: helix-turn-helix domain-containing protein [Dehalococcoidales bacterium]|nr:helix-turn-helix domain-containing protein [Dehalococcoidales bacterium]